MYNERHGDVLRGWGGGSRTHTLLRLLLCCQTTLQLIVCACVRVSDTQAPHVTCISVLLFPVEVVMAFIERYLESKKTCFGIDCGM